jgi:hypothetical protein
LVHIITHESKGTKVTMFYYERLYLLQQGLYIRLELRFNKCCACSNIASINTSTIVQVDELVTEDRHRYVDESIENNTAIATFFR